MTVPRVGNNVQRLLVDSILCYKCTSIWSIRYVRGRWSAAHGPISMAERKLCLLSVRGRCKDMSCSRLSCSSMQTRMSAQLKQSPATSSLVTANPNCEFMLPAWCRSSFVCASVAVERHCHSLIFTVNNAFFCQLHAVDFDVFRRTHQREPAALYAPTISAGAMVNFIRYV